jgi:hypothetical protein
MSTDKNKTLGDQLQDFKLNHYKNLDIDYWQFKVDTLYVKLKRLNDPTKQGRVIMELYATYLQLLEVLFINSFAISRQLDGFPDAIFIESGDIKRFIGDNFLKQTKYSKWFFDNYIFLIQKDVEDSKDRRPSYENMLMECAKDYLNSYQLLNSYKHGYRVSAKHGKNSISLVDKQGANQIRIECDSEITYYSKEKIEDPVNPELVNKKVIYKRKVSFNNSRIFSKAAFAITLLQNLRLTAIQSLGGTTREKVLLLFIDKDAWKDSFGEFSFKEPLFSITKLPPPSS